MLYIFTKVSKNERRNYINDVEIVFNSIYKKLIKINKVKKIILHFETDGNESSIKELETYETIRSKFGDTKVTNISTGCKALILAVCFPDKIINFTEAGNNIINKAIELSDNYSMKIYLAKDIAAYDRHKEVYIDGKIKEIKELRKILNGGGIYE